MNSSHKPIIFTKTYLVQAREQILCS
jgi:hypothetical protein